MPWLRVRTTPALPLHDTAVSAPQSTSTSTYSSPSLSLFPNSPCVFVPSIFPPSSSSSRLQLSSPPPSSGLASPSSRPTPEPGPPDLLSQMLACISTECTSRHENKARAVRRMRVLRQRAGVVDEGGQWLATKFVAKHVTSGLEWVG